MHDMAIHCAPQQFLMLGVGSFNIPKATTQVYQWLASWKLVQTHYIYSFGWWAIEKLTTQCNMPIGLWASANGWILLVALGKWISNAKRNLVNGWWAVGDEKSELIYIYFAAWVERDLFLILETTIQWLAICNHQHFSMVVCTLGATQAIAFHHILKKCSHNGQIIIPRFYVQVGHCNQQCSMLYLQWGIALSQSLNPNAGFLAECWPKVAAKRQCYFPSESGLY